MINIKIKRFLAFYIDMLLIMVASYVFSWTIIWGFDNPQIFPDIFLILSVLWAMLRDFTFQNKSFGKKIFHLSIYDSSGKEVYDWKQLLAVNFISTILFPISILTTFTSNQSIGDMLLGTSVSSSKEKSEGVENKCIVNSIIKYILIFIPIIYLIVEFLFFQDFNFYSVRILLVIGVLSLLFVILKVFIKNLIVRISIFVVFGTILMPISSVILFEDKFIKFTRLEDSLNYSYHDRVVQNTVVVKDSTLVFLNDIILDYKKDDKEWNIINPLKEDRNTINIYSKDLIGEDFIRTRKYDFTYKYLDDLDKTAIMITIEYGIDISLQDSINTEFEVKEEKYISRYFGVIDGELSDSYTVIINDEEFYPFYNNR